ncbi:MAG: HlyC/CorC family transporter [Candidatus Omnitrophica bacterium]|nr:HlyC/CorC family transporter [Candidatus Omnitrophota bacterium]
MAELTLLFLIIFFCLVLSSFFSGVETAVISSNRLRLRHLADRGNKEAHRLLRILEYPDRVISTVLVGNNIVNVTIASLVTLLCIHWVGSHSEWLAALIATPLVLVFGELIPKVYCRFRADRVVLLAERPLRWMLWFFSPLVAVVRYISEVILAFFGVPSAPPQKVRVTKEELKYLLQEEAHGIELDPQERSLITKIFQFSDLQVTEVMLGLDKTAMLPAQATVKDLKELLKQTGFSRYPVYDGQNNNVIGIVHILDALFESPETDSIKKFLRPANFIHMETLASTALFILQSRKQPMAIVVSRTRGPVGMVTIADLVEQIVGEVGAG